MKKCWPCRRRRLKCDGALPSCQKCQANAVKCTYTKPLTWVGGVASRGHLMNSTFDEAYAPRKDVTPTSKPSDVIGDSPDPPSDAILSSRSRSLSENGMGLTVVSALSRPLTEPIFQDLGYNARFLVDYFQQRVCPAMFLVNSAKNPYRQVVSMIGSSPALVNAILALAACHCAHSATGFPLFTFRRDRMQPLAPKKQIMFPTSSDHGSSVSQSDLLNQYLVLKQDSLRHLSAALADSDNRNQSGTLATVLLLALLELLESGAGFWNVHIEGAKTLLEDGAKRGINSHTPLIKSMIDELILFDTFGSTLIRPGVLTRSISSRLACDTEGEAHGIAGVGCPTVIIMAIDFVSSQRQASIGAVLENSDLPIQSLYATLRQIQDFDIQIWATNVVTCTSLKVTSISPKDLAHIGTIWKLAAEIYASRLLYNLVEDHDLLLPLVDVLRHEYVTLGADHHLVNGLAWPAFIAGASSSRPEQRVWALEVLERIWNGTMCANVKNAPLVLERLWEKQDMAREKSGCHEPGAWDWITELSSLEDRWIFL